MSMHPAPFRYEEYTYIFPFVVRDFKIMEGIQDASEVEMSANSTRRRPQSPFVPSVEMTASRHFDVVEDEGIIIDKLAKTESLFDYGAN